MHLPTIRIPEFSGDIGKWLTFKNIFEVFVHKAKMTPLQKFSHLQTYLKGEAAEKIKIFSVCDENYEIAWEFLNSAYNRVRPLMVKHLDAILDIPK